MRSAALALQPRVLIPMHVRCVGDLPLYERFRAEVGPRLPRTQVVAPGERGERFRFAAGRLVKAASEPP